MKIYILLSFMIAAFSVYAQVNPGRLYAFDSSVSTRWSSPENINGAKGAGGKENAGAKGRPSKSIAAGGSQVLLTAKGPGMINRIWITVGDRSPEMLRSLKLEMFWDNSSRPAVSVPLGDFFGMSLGRMSSFQNALFASPEGRSFNCFIPMPFRKSARIIIVNESSKTLNHIFFDINYQLKNTWEAGNLYFHAYWHRDTATALMKDFELLPEVSGKGRLLGINAGINANPVYGNTWWGEGEVKAYMDGDKDWPTLVGTGTEDYIGDAWGQSSFVNNYTGCLIADEKKKQWSFYRYHIADPVFFRKHFRMTLQQIGSSERKTALGLNLPPSLFIPTTVDDGKGNITHLFADRKPLEENPGITDYALFYRSDDMCSTAYFYLDKPFSGLPEIQPLAIRTYNLKPDKE